MNNFLNESKQSIDLSYIKKSLVAESSAVKGDGYLVELPDAAIDIIARCQLRAQEIGAKVPAAKDVVMAALLMAEKNFSGVINSAEVDAALKRWCRGKNTPAARRV